MKKLLCFMLISVCVIASVCACTEETKPTSSESLLLSLTPTPFEETAKSISNFKIIYPEDDYTHPIHYKSIALEFRTELLANCISMKMSSDMIDAENGLEESK